MNFSETETPTPAELQEQAEMLYEASRLLAHPLSGLPMLERVMAALMNRYALEACALFLPVAGESPLRCTYALGLSKPYADRLRVTPGEGAAGVAYVSGQLRLVDDIRGPVSDAQIEELRQRHHVRSALYVPLTSEGQTIGLAGYFSKAPDGFSTERAQALQRFSNQLALALHNRSRYQALETTNRRLETESATMVRQQLQTQQQLMGKVREIKTIYDLALATAASTQVDQIVRVIIRGVQEMVEAQSGAFFLLSPDHRLIPISPAFDREGEDAQGLACSPEEAPFLQRALEEGEPQTLHFLDQHTPLPAAWASLNIRSLLVLPLRQGDAVKGVFVALNKVNGLFSEDDERLLSLLTSRVADVLERLALDQQLRQRVHDLSVLQDLSTRLPNPPVLTDTLAAIARGARSAIPGLDLCLFFIHHPESETLAMMGGDWDHALPLEVSALTVGASEKVPVVEVFRDGRPLFYERATASAAWNEDGLVNAIGLSQLGYMPLPVEGGRIGVMAIGTRRPEGLSLDARRLAELIAQQQAVVIERSRLYERLRRANQKLEQMNQLKNEFISMVSHELRTPLTTIKGFVSIVANEETGPLNDQQRHFLQTSDRAIDRLTLLVSDLLDISRMEAGQIKMQMRPSVLRDIVDRVLAGYLQQFKAQNLTLSVKIPDPLPPVLVDPDRVTQVFDNLLTNAFKFTHKGGITISASDKGDFVMVSIKDTGTGIPKEELERVFEKFYQVKAGNAYPSKGTGLGLAIVRSIIESHRGKVWVESDPETGADFRFILPRARSETPAPPAA